MRLFVTTCLLTLRAGVEVCRAEQPALAQLEHELDAYASEQRYDRILGGATSLALGAGLIPIGTLLLRRQNAVVKVTGISALVTGSVQLLGAQQLFFRSTLERVRDRHLQRKARHTVSDDELVRATEQDFRETARQEHVRRTLIGVPLLTLGVLALPTGLTLLLTRHRVDSLSRHSQYNLGSSLLSLGIPFVMHGVRFVFQKGPTQSAFDAYERQHATLVNASFDAVPVHGGIVFAGSAQF